jgi:hypothetical protein
MKDFAEEEEEGEVVVVVDVEEHLDLRQVAMKVGLAQRVMLTSESCFKSDNLMTSVGTQISWAILECGNAIDRKASKKKSLQSKALPIVVRAI